MPIDLIEAVRKKSSAEAPVEKINPNTQAPEHFSTSGHQLENAVIPALLVGFYKQTRDEEHAADLISKLHSENILEALFGEKKSNVVQSIANYSRVSVNESENELKHTATKIGAVLNNEIKTMDGKSISAFFSAQRSNILKHLPVELNMGEYLKDSSVDDRTNKMEGPMSDMMHTIEKIFSSTK